MDGSSTFWPYAFNENKSLITYASLLTCEIISLILFYDYNNLII
jgi:hypothetical protein